MKAKPRLSTGTDFGTKFGSSRFSQNSCGLEHVPETYRFFGSDMLRLFEPKRFLFEQMSPSGGQAH